MKSIRTLAVDDSEQFLDALSTFLDSFSGIELVERALTGAEALQSLPAAKPDLVLVDLVMPGMDGLELTEKIKSVSEAPRVVILTLAEHADYESHVRAAGADGLLRKYEMAELFYETIEGLFPGVLGRI